MYSTTTRCRAQTATRPRDEATLSGSARVPAPVGVGSSRDSGSVNSTAIEDAARAQLQRNEEVGRLITDY